MFVFFSSLFFSLNCFWIQTLHKQIWIFFFFQVYKTSKIIISLSDNSSIARFLKYVLTRKIILKPVKMACSEYFDRELHKITKLNGLYSISYIFFFYFKSKPSNFESFYASLSLILPFQRKKQKLCVILKF